MKTREEIEARIAELQAKNDAAPGWGGAVSARYEEMRELRGELLRMTRHIYVASSWRNEHFDGIVKTLRDHGHQVYDFKNSPNAFSWDQIDPGWRQWRAATYVHLLNHPTAQAGYMQDMAAMRWADTCVLVLPCGRSAHLEAGWFAGQGKELFILTRDGEEPELMAKMATDILVSETELVQRLAQRKGTR